MDIDYDRRLDEVSTEDMVKALLSRSQGLVLVLMRDANSAENGSDAAMFCGLNKTCVVDVERFCSIIVRACEESIVRFHNEAS